MPNETIRPSVEVRVPKVNLRVDDIAYLRSLQESNDNNKAACAISHSRMSRLRLLDLIETKKLPVADSEIAKAKDKIAILKKEIINLVNSEQWDKISNFVYDAKRAKDNMEPRLRDVLTEKGKLLLKDGSVTVKMRKVGCG